MAEIKEIEEWSKYIDDKHTDRIKEQKEDQNFYLDKYTIPIVEDERYLIRTGYVAGMANGVTQQAIAFAPKVYTLPKKDTAQMQKSADKIASKGNEWVKQLSRQSINPFRETFKKLGFNGGEAWIYVAHNEDLVMYNGNWRDVFPNRVPIHFILYDPMIVFHDPAEEIDGIPKRVKVQYMRNVGDIRASYPFWKGKTNYAPHKQVMFKYFMDKDTRYAVADDEPLFRNLKGELANGDGRLSNPYGFVPFSHKYSGYGIDTEKKDPALLAFSRTRMIREKIIEDSSMATDFRYNMHEFAWKVKTIFWPMDVPKPDDFMENYRNRVNVVNVLELPPGAKMEVEETQAFGAEAYAYRDRVRADLNAEYPLGMKGQASGTSGRQEDILANAGMAMYDSPIEANSLLWAEAIDMAFKVCAIEKLDLLPEGISKVDCNSYSELTVDITKEDPQDMSRRQAEGDRRFQMGIIDMEELYINYMKKTKEEAQKLKARVWIEQAMRTDPAFQQLIIQTAAQEMGQEERLNQIKQMIEGGAQSMNPVPQTGSKGGKPRIGNIQTERGTEMADQATRHETRRPPIG